jgi:hypothetical protein
MKPIKLTVKNFDSNKYNGLLWLNFDEYASYDMDYKFNHNGVEFRAYAKISLEKCNLVCTSHDFTTFYVKELETRCRNRYCNNLIGCEECDKGYKNEPTWKILKKSFIPHHKFHTMKEIKSLKSAAKKAMKKELFQQISKLVGGEKHAEPIYGDE